MSDDLRQEWIEKAEIELAKAEDAIVASAKGNETFTKLVDQWQDD
jgi:hypothetical protein